MGRGSPYPAGASGAAFALELLSPFDWDANDADGGTTSVVVIEAVDVVIVVVSELNKKPQYRRPLGPQFDGKMARYGYQVRWVRQPR